MIIKIRVPTDVQVTHIKCVLPVNHGEENIPNDFPGRVGDVLTLLIDIDTRRIVGWPAGKTFDLHMKVRDDGSYYLLDGQRQVRAIEREYVPDCIPGSYGDYVEMQICNDGTIRRSDGRPWVLTSHDVFKSFVSER